MSAADPAAATSEANPGDAAARALTKLQVTKTPPSGNDNRMDFSSVVGELASALKEIVGDSRETRLASTLNNIRVLNGNEGPESVRMWFTEFDLITKKWGESDKLEALGVKLKGRARTVLTCIPYEIHRSYPDVRHELLLRLADDERQRTTNLSMLMSGKPRGVDETIADFGDRVLRLVKNSCMPNCPTEQVEDLCKTYFLQWLNDRELISSLVEQRNAKCFRYLVDHAVTLRHSLNQVKWPAAAPNPAPNAANTGYQRSIAQQPSGINQGRPVAYQAAPPATTNVGATNAQNAPKPYGGTQNQSGTNNKAWFPKAAGSFASNNANRTTAHSLQTQVGGGATSLPSSTLATGTLEQSSVWGMPAQYWHPLDKQPASNTSGQHLATISSSNEFSKSDLPAIGASAQAVVMVEGMPCLSLYDSGAQLTLMSMPYLKGLLLEKKVDPETWPVDRSAIDVKAANQQPLNCAYSTVLRIARGDLVAKVRVQLTMEPLSFPLIIGTNAFEALSMALVDSRTGQKLIKESAASVSALQSASSEVFVCNIECVLQQSSRFITQKTTLPDGSYIFTQSVGVPDQSLVTVSRGKLSVCLANWGSEPLIVEPHSRIGLLEAVAQSSFCSEQEFSKKAWSDASGKAHLYALGTDTKPPTDIAERLKFVWEACEIDKSPIDEGQKAELRELLRLNTYAFALDTCELTGANIEPIRLELSEDKIVRCTEAPIPYALRKDTAKLLQDHVDRGLIKDSMSPYCSPTIIVRKKDNSLRFVTDLRRVNRLLKCPAYPIPNCENVILTLGKRRYFTSLDLRSGYFQLKLHPDSAPFTAFAALGRQFQYNVLPMGLNGSPAYFQQTMNRIFEGLIGKSMIVYLDDLLCASETWEEHMELLREVFRRLTEAGLKLHPSKCRIATHSVKFLGHILCAEGIRKDDDKTKPLRNYPVPVDKKALQSFLGVLGYYRKFVRGYAQLAAPLYALTKKDAPFVWTSVCQHSFDDLCRIMCEDVTLAFPDFVAASSDPRRRLTIQCDASRDGLGAVLCQRDEQLRMRPIYFISRMTSDAEKRYEGITVLEAAAVRFATKKWAAYIIGLPTVVETDHIALVSMFTKDKECGNARVDKWAMDIKSRFDLTFVYKAGKTHVVADGLSRSVVGTGERAHVSAVKTRGHARRLEAIAEKSESDPESEVEFECPASDNPKTHSLMPETALPDDWNSLVVQEWEGVIHFLSAPHAEKMATGMPEDATSFTLASERLYRIDSEKLLKPVLRLVVPSKYQKCLFDERHSGQYGAHACYSKIYAQLKKLYWWPRMSGDILRWTKACQVCAFTRNPRKNIPPLLPIDTNRPWELICIDILQLPASAFGEKYALVAVDHFTRFGFAFAVRDKSAETTARTLVERILLPYGPCERIHHDKGTEFVNRIVQVLVETFRMGQSTTAGYNPRCNGACEKLNQQLIRMLSRTTVIPQCWTERLPYVLFAYNSVPNESTGYPPFELMFGRPARFPSQISAELVPGPYACDLDDYRMIFAQNLNDVLVNVRLKSSESRLKSKANYDTAHKVMADKYKPGDRVALREPDADHSANKKLHWNTSGPFRVVEVKQNNATLAPWGKVGADRVKVPLDRLVKIPTEVPEMTYSRKPDRARLIGIQALCIYVDSATLELTKGCFAFVYPTSDATWTSPARETVIITLKSSTGLGAYDECDGLCTDHCRGVTIGDIAPDNISNDESFRLRLVPTLAHQIAIARATLVMDGFALGELSAKILNTEAEALETFLNASCRTRLPGLGEEMLDEQVRLRADSCEITRQALKQSGALPITCIVTETESVKMFSCLQLKDAHIGICHPGSNVLGRAWEKLRNSTGRTLLQDPFYILCTSDEKQAFENTDATVGCVENMLEATTFARQKCFGGNVTALLVTLPLASEGLLAKMRRFVDMMAGYPHVTVRFLPPPPVRTIFYGEVAAYLLTDGGELYANTPDGGSLLQASEEKKGELNTSSVQVGRYGSGVDNRYVAKGSWNPDGWRLVRTHWIQLYNWGFLRDKLSAKRASSVPGAERKESKKLQKPHGPSSSQQHPDRLHGTQTGRITKPNKASSDLTSIVTEILNSASHQPSTSSQSRHAASSSYKIPKKSSSFNNNPRRSQ